MPDMELQPPIGPFLDHPVPQTVPGIHDEVREHVKHGCEKVPRHKDIGPRTGIQVGGIGGRGSGDRCDGCRRDRLGRCTDKIQDCSSRFSQRVRPQMKENTPNAHPHSARIRGYVRPNAGGLAVFGFVCWWCLEEKQ